MRKRVDEGKKDCGAGSGDGLGDSVGAGPDPGDPNAGGGPGAGAVGAGAGNINLVREENILSELSNEKKKSMQEFKICILKTNAGDRSLFGLVSRAIRRKERK